MANSMAISNDKLENLFDLYITDFVEQLVDECISGELDFELSDDIIAKYADANDCEPDRVKQLFDKRLDETRYFG